MRANAPPEAFFVGPPAPLTIAIQATLLLRIRQLEARHRYEANLLNPEQAE